MSTTLFEENGEDVSITQFYGGKIYGLMLQITARNKDGDLCWIQLTKNQVRKIQPVLSEWTDGEGLVIKSIVHAARNVEKWGLQDVSTLIHAMTEEMGELAQAYLQSQYEGKSKSRIRDELIDLTALCLQLSQKLEEEEK